MQTTIADIMTTNVVWISPSKSLFEAYQVMKDFGIKQLPVKEPRADKIVGIISEGDIILYCYKHGVSLEVDDDIQVKCAMTKKIVYCYPSSNITNVATTLIAAKIDSIPVLTENAKELIGIVTTTDFLDQLCMNEELTGRDVHPYNFGTTKTKAS